MTEQLRVGVYAVSDAQAGLVRALVKLLSRNADDFAWTFTTHGPFDALIVAGHAADLSHGDVRGSARAYASLGNPQHPGWPGEILPWPLAPDRLQSWLTRVGDVLEDAATQPMPLPDLPAARADPGDTGVRYRLKRWPPSELLRGDRQRIRIASLLSRRALPVGEIARLSGQPVERCRTFLNLLQGFGLVEITSTAPPAASHPGIARVERGLIHRLRQRLGI